MKQIKIAAMLAAGVATAFLTMAPAFAGV